LLRLACGAHVARMKDAKSGLGVDRHMYAMNKVAKLLRDQRIDFHIPQIFNDMAYSKLMTSVLSTSNVSHPCFHLFGFGPVCADGLGIAYNVHGDRMFVNVTSFKEQARPYAMELTKTLKEMMQVAREDQNAK
jgi:carnitine O-acetyltransferase